MDRRLGSETFRFDPEFFEVYTFFLNKYFHSSDSASYMLKHLVTDLQQKLGCLAVALVRFNARDEGSVDLHHPPDESSLIDRILQREDVKAQVRELFTAERFGGDSLELDLSLRGDEPPGIMEIDLIPVPYLPEPDTGTDFVQAFMLVDPVQMKALANHRAERGCQRSIVAQFLFSWWVKVAASRSGLARTTCATQQDETSPIVSRWLYVATLPELIQEGVRCRKLLRRQGKPKEFSFEGDITNSGALWNEWTPRLPLPGLSGEELRRVRENGRSLVAWCGWIDSHPDLEEERTLPAYPSSPDEEAKDNSVADWVRRQREKIAIIDERLDHLRRMAAAAFREGTPESIFEPKRNEHEVLPVDHKALLCFGLSRWLASKEDGGMCRELSSVVLSDVEFCRAMHGVAVTAHYLFGGQPLKEDVIHRLIQLLTQYCHVALDLPSRLDLRAHLLYAARGEPALHVLKPFYRDHLFHALEVCFLGHVLLETKLSEDRFLWQLVAERIHADGDKRRVLSLWYLAALSHDIGYAMDVLDSSRKYLGFFRHSKALRRLNKSIKQSIDNLSDEKAVKSFDIDIKDGTERDHGIIGALHLDSLIRRIAQDDPNLDGDEYEPAIRAVALHNLRRHSDTVSFAKQPIAFLLAICDQLQEWRRPRLMYSTSPGWFLSRLGGVSPDVVGLEGAFKSMSANVEALAGDLGDVNLRFRSNPMGHPHLAFTLEYDEEINRNSGVFQLWLDATLNFQRLDFEEFPMDITVTYVTPCYRNRTSDAQLNQLHRLRDAAHETHMTFLADWFPTSQVDGTFEASLTEEAVTYQFDGRERLTLNLRSLSDRVLMTKSMDDFWRCLKEWRYFNDDRDFPGDYVRVIPG